MFDVDAVLTALAAMLALAGIAWSASLVKQDVSIVDSFWSLFFIAGALAYAESIAADSPRAILVILLTALWALRLCLYLTWRNWGEPEDRRYRAIRARNAPGFAWKSLYLVFGLQALLAWIVAMPVFAGIGGASPLNALDYAGVLLWLIGFSFETIGDAQLARFKADPANQGQVLQTGLWRYTRHPNYFGEATLWWGLYLIAGAGGSWWTVFAPILMSFLLLRVSGVRLLEQDIYERRPEYRRYVARTSAFFPRPPKEFA